MEKQSFHSGDWIIFRKQKVSTSPGPRAKSMAPSSKGDNYSYVVDKYWVVDEVLDDGLLCVRTRRGKQHVVGAHDPRMRKPNWLERWLLGDRFRAVANPDDVQ